jgi:16S rRNA C1402 (ribose-2'-O) methylase RsmI
VDKLKAARPQRAKRTKKVQPPLSADDKELFEEKEEVTKIKYAPRMKVGTPTIKAPGTKVVKTVGLGNLQVETINGNTNVQP